MDRSEKTGIEDAIAAVGGNQSALARLVSEETGRVVRQGHVSYWIKKGYVSGEDDRAAVAKVSGVAVERLKRPSRRQGAQEVTANG